METHGLLSYGKKKNSQTRGVSPTTGAAGSDMEVIVLNPSKPSLPNTINSSHFNAAEKRNGKDSFRGGGGGVAARCPAPFCNMEPSSGLPPSPSQSDSGGAPPSHSCLNWIKQEVFKPDLKAGWGVEIWRQNELQTSTSLSRRTKETSFRWEIQEEKHLCLEAPNLQNLLCSRQKPLCD